MEVQDLGLVSRVQDLGEKRQDLGFRLQDLGLISWI
jgi:hypothetical protein